MTAGSGLGTLTAFEVERLNAGQQLFFEAEFGRGQFVEVAAVGFLLIR